MSNLLPLKGQIIYGPVNSRRLGRSLGINLLPPAQKWCTFDCLYCQYGWSHTTAINRSEEMRDLPGIHEVVQAVEMAIKNLSEPPAYLTFSGNGEPTLHPDFPRIVDAIVSLRNRLVPKAKTAVLSNAGGIGNPAVRKAMMKLDRPILKLDAGNESVFRAFNRPVPGIEYEDIAAGLEEMRDIFLQSLFAAGPEGNLKDEHIADWIEMVKRIRPREAQIYTLARAVPCGSITQVASSALLAIRRMLIHKGISAEVFF